MRSSQFLCPGCLYHMEAHGYCKVWTQSYSIQSDGYKLEHKGDVQQWQIDSVTSINDLLDSKATIMDYVLHCIMKSLNGRSKTIQYRIADDINTKEIGDRTNIYDMLQDYASAMATVGDGNSKPTNMINKSNNKTGNKHFDKSANKAGDKDKNHDSKGKHKKKGPKNGKHCDYCGWDGHDISECRKKKAADEAAKANNKPTASQTQPTAAGKVNQATNQPFTRDELQSMINNFKTGKCGMVRVEPPDEDNNSSQGNAPDSFILFGTDFEPILPVCGHRPCHRPLGYGDPALCDFCILEDEAMILPECEECQREPYPDSDEDYTPADNTPADDDNADNQSDGSNNSDAWEELDAPEGQPDTPPQMHQCAHMACGRQCSVRYRHCLPCSSSEANNVCDNCDTTWIPEIDNNSSSTARCNNPTNANIIKDGNWLPLCGGMDCLGIIARKQQLQPEHLDTKQS